MTRGARISPEVIDQVERTWAKDPRQSAPQVLKRLTGRARGRIGLRKVQQIIANVRSRGAGEWEPMPWTPWKADCASSGQSVSGEEPLQSEPRWSPETPEDSRYLFDLHRRFLSIFDRGLYRHEAEWARRLRAILSDENPNFELLILLLYFERVDDALSLDREPYTQDLDAVLTFRAWESQYHWREYAAAVKDGRIESPEMTFDVLEDEWTATAMATFCDGTDALLLMFVFSERNPRFFEQKSDGWSGEFLDQSHFTSIEKREFDQLVRLTADGLDRCQTTFEDLSS